LGTARVFVNSQNSEHLSGVSILGYGVNDLDAEASADNLSGSSHGRFGCAASSPSIPQSPKSEYLFSFRLYNPFSITISQNQRADWSVHQTWSSRLIRRWRIHPREALGRPRVSLSSLPSRRLPMISRAGSPFNFLSKVIACSLAVPPPLSRLEPQTKATPLTCSDRGSRNFTHYLNERVKLSL